MEAFRSVDKYLRLGAAHFVLFFAFILSLVALPVPVMGEIRPYFLLTVIYYWSVFRPTLVPVWLCFLVGLGQDIVGMYPLGMHALIYILLRMIISDQRRFLIGQTYITGWAVFSLVCVLAAGLKWVMVAFTQEGLPALSPLMAESVFTILIYPVMSFCLIMLHRLLPPPPRHLP